MMYSICALNFLPILDKLDLSNTTYLPGVSNDLQNRIRW